MTQALILAAGQGTRLRPLTDNKPKCLVPLWGTSLLERQVKTLKQADVQDICVATGYCHEQIDAMGFTTAFNADFATTNMVESLFCAHEFITSCEDDLIIGYGDIVYNLENLQALLACQDEIALMVDKDWLKLWSLRLANPLEDAETLLHNDEHYLLELGKKPQDFSNIQGQYTGLIKIRGDKRRAIYDYYQQLDTSAVYDGKDFRNMYMTTFLQSLIDQAWPVKAVFVNNGWLEIDSTEDLYLYENLAKEGKLTEFYQV